MDFTLAKLNTILGLPIMADAPLSGVAVDSRQVRRADLFVAMSGSKVDGHDYARAAAAAGARALLGEYRPAGLPPGYPVLIVPDSREALLKLASAMKKEAGFRLAALAGSAGQTPTQEVPPPLFAPPFLRAQNPPH